MHKIGILDLRILNLDRNCCNILVQTKKSYDDDIEDTWSLIPIDHGLSIPDTLEVSSFELAWMSFSQSEAPFSSRSIEYINSIDIDADI